MTDVVGVTVGKVVEEAKAKLPITLGVIYNMVNPYEKEVSEVNHV